MQVTLAVHFCDNQKRKRDLVLTLKRFLVRRRSNFDRFDDVQIQRVFPEEQLLVLNHEVDVIFHKARNF